MDRAIRNFIEAEERYKRTKADVELKLNVRQALLEQFMQECPRQLPTIEDLNSARNNFDFAVGQHAHSVATLALALCKAVLERKYVYTGRQWSSEKYLLQ